MKKLRNQTRIFLLSGLILLSTNLYSQDPDFYIFLCFGQSNMEGQGSVEKQDKTVDSRFQVMEAVSCTNLGRTMGSWYKAIPPLCRCYSGLSPVDFFGRTMVANLPDSIRIGVINVSVAGCKIELFDKHNYPAYVATAPSWMLNIINEYSGNPYKRLVDIANLAQKEGVIKGILLHQGESNTNDQDWPTKVKGVYDTLLNDLGLAPGSVPLLAGEVVHADQGGVCASMNSIIAKLPETLPNSYVIPSSGCKDAADNLHFNAEGYRELGWRYAVKMLTILDYDTTGMIDLRPTPAPLETRSLRTEAEGFLLAQNYPNPFNSKTNIIFEIPANTFVSLKVYNSLGAEIAELAGKNFQQGRHTVELDSENLSPGIYFYSINTGKFLANRKMVIQRE